MSDDARSGGGDDGGTHVDINSHDDVLWPKIKQELMRDTLCSVALIVDVLTVCASRCYRNVISKVTTTSHAR